MNSKFLFIWEKKGFEEGHEVKSSNPIVTSCKIRLVEMIAFHFTKKGSVFIIRYPSLIAWSKM